MTTTTIKIYLEINEIKKDGECPIYLRVIKDRKKKLFYLGHNSSTEYWDFQTHRPNRKHPNSKDLAFLLNAHHNRAIQIVYDLEKTNPHFTLEDFAKQFKDKVETVSVISFTEKIKQDFLKINEIRTADSYKQLAAKLTKFCEKNSISTNFTFSDLNLSFLNKLELSMREDKLADTSMSVYFRTLRAVYNKGIVEGYVKKELYPFNEYKVSKFSTQTRKRAISRQDIQKIIDLTLEEGTNLYDARNIFLFSYYTMGTNYIDLAYLEWKDVNNDKLVYERSKTGDLFNLKLVEPAKKVLEYYKTYRANNYIFPILDKAKHSDNPQKAAIRLQTANKIINKKLKEIGKMAGIETEITTYVARHSSATNLKRANVAVSVISQAMGHESEKVTQIYLDSIENDAVDNALDALL